MREIRKKVKLGLLDPDSTDPFELFISTNEIRFCYYKDTGKILGNTFDMLILQDFEGLTPNLLARCIETVRGGGVIVFLVKGMSSLRSLYSLTMDVHARYRTEAYSTVVPRFSERFVLSLASCPMAAAVDEELNILPISSHIRKISSFKKAAIAEARASGRSGLANDDGGNAFAIEETDAAIELRQVKKSLADEQPVGALVETTVTLDQARALLVFVEAISEKTLRSTVTLTAARGRGKSAALGLSIAAAIGYGYSNIFVTSPSPENLKTLFEFVVIGLKALGFIETADFNVVASKISDEDYATVTRINVFRDHRQTVQYILPQDSDKLGQAELVVIDEAAAIPITYVKALLGNYLVFLASTVNGYEGTGRSLSLKLIKKLREQSSATSNGAGPSSGSNNNTSAGSRDDVTTGRALREITLTEPIRYSEGDEVEKWLHKVLCLDVAPVPRLGARAPHPSECQLYAVDRDALFSYHAASEAFLQRMMALYVSSHYKNTPNDLQLMSDAPAHRLFVLLPPVDPSSTELPQVLVVIQVCLEGKISRESVMSSLTKGKRSAGDLIPWTVAQQFQDNDFASLSGARVVRIATHPEYTRLGYGSRALDLLKDYYNGEFGLVQSGPIVPPPSSGPGAHENDNDDENNLLKEKLKPRKAVPPLLTPLSQRPAEALDYLGVSYGMTQSLYTFWKRADFVPVYVRQSPNEMTGEHTAIMLHPLAGTGSTHAVASDWAAAYYVDFRARFFELLSFSFASLPPSLALSIVTPPESLDLSSLVRPIGPQELGAHVTEHDLKRLQVFSMNIVDRYVVMDLIAKLTRLYFLGRLPQVALRLTQAVILLAVGGQHLTIDQAVALLGRPSAQVQALFSQGVKAIEKALRTLKEAEVAASLPAPQDTVVGMELAPSETNTKVDELLEDASLAQYAIGGENEDWDRALSKARSGDAVPSSVSIASGKRKREDPASKRDSSFRPAKVTKTIAAGSDLKALQRQAAAKKAASTKVRTDRAQKRKKAAKARAEAMLGGASSSKSSKSSKKKGGAKGKGKGKGKSRK